MSNQPIVIKKIEEDGHHGHHGGAWKVAFADFMTAMMAFFLLMWLLGATDEDQRKGIADYFTPSLSEAGGRGQGILAGQVLAEDGSLGGVDGPEGEQRVLTFGQENPLAVFDSRIRYEQSDAQSAGVIQEGGGLAEDGEETLPKLGAGEEDGDVGPAEGETASPSATAAHKAMAEIARQAELEAVQEKIEAALKADPALEGLKDNLTFELTREGLEIQVIDAEGRSMFAIGSAAISSRTEALLGTIADAIAPLEWPIAISGHTDSLQYADGAQYSNWELSADRANATRRVLVKEGVAAARIAKVAAFADTDPVDPARADAPKNRRIGILLQYQSVEAALSPTIWQD